MEDIIKSEYIDKTKKLLIENKSILGDELKAKIDDLCKNLTLANAESTYIKISDLVSIAYRKSEHEFTMATLRITGSIFSIGVLSYAMIWGCKKYYSLENNKIMQYLENISVATMCIGVCGLFAVGH